MNIYRKEFEAVLRRALEHPSSEVFPSISAVLYRALHRLEAQDADSPHAECAAPTSPMSVTEMMYNELADVSVDDKTCVEHFRFLFWIQDELDAPYTAFLKRGLERAVASGNLPLRDRLGRALDYLSSRRKELQHRAANGPTQP